MYIFKFNYLNEEHCAKCDESCLKNRNEQNLQFYKDLASFIIESYLKENKIFKSHVYPKNVRIYEVDKIENYTEIPNPPICSFDEVNFSIPVNSIERL